ncbi:MAG TPA: endonuclease/exonuclease/phosphatase family protein [Longimicrobiales bacterium]|nr:endonuclease/exonuclease/phosphatase family protein [Longimicrobiales bacterium]
MERTDPTRRHTRRRTLRRAAAIVIVLPALGSCRWAQNYTDPAGPRFAGALPGPPPSAEWGGTLRVVSFNVERGVQVDSALAVLRTDPGVAEADVVLLQEMEETGTRRIAEALGMAFVYYPAVRYDGDGRHFGNAVLSRWPIVDDEKLLLPHRSVFGRTQRIATAATIRVGRTPVRVYSVHLGTPANMALRDRADQLRTVLQDAARHPHVILGGDLNSGGLGDMARRRGYAWPTEDGPRTLVFGRWDHVLFKGLTPPEEDAAGTVMNNRGASDHKPVWALGTLR